MGLRGQQCPWGPPCDAPQHTSSRTRGQDRRDELIRWRCAIQQGSAQYTVRSMQHSATQDNRMRHRARPSRAACVRSSGRGMGITRPAPPAGSQPAPIWSRAGSVATCSAGCSLAVDEALITAAPRTPRLQARLLHSHCGSPRRAGIPERDQAAGKRPARPHLRREWAPPRQPARTAGSSAPVCVRRSLTLRNAAGSVQQAVAVHM